MFENCLANNILQVWNLASQDCLTTSALSCTVSSVKLGGAAVIGSGFVNVNWPLSIITINRQTWHHINRYKDLLLN